MNNRQWYVFGVLFVLASMFFVGKAVEGAGMAVAGDDFVFLAGSLRSVVFGSLATLTIVVGFGCLIAGYLEEKR